jgi:predicted GNAT family acetyltransferase
MTSLYGQYIKEREGFDIVETEYGFATYTSVDEQTIYLRDIFIVAEKRRSGLATELSTKVAEIAKELGKNKILGSICIDAKGVTTSMAALLGDKFKFSHANGNMLYFVKDI